MLLSLEQATMSASAASPATKPKARAAWPESWGDRMRLPGRRGGAALVCRSAVGVGGRKIGHLQPEERGVAAVAACLGAAIFGERVRLVALRVIGVTTHLVINPR